MARNFFFDKKWTKKIQKVAEKKCYIFGPNRSANFNGTTMRKNIFAWTIWSKTLKFEKNGTKVLHKNIFEPQLDKSSPKTLIF